MVRGAEGKGRAAISSLGTLLSLRAVAVAQLEDMVCGGSQVQLGDEEVG